MRSSLRTRLLIAAAAIFTTSSAHASNVTEFPDNGSEQMARGGAWVARASDPLAAFFNPAGLAGQDSKITIQANLSLLNTCFTRVKSANDTSNEPLADPTTGVFPQVCNDASLQPNPQLAATIKLTDRLGLGIAVLGPSGVANASWPEFTDNKGTPSAAPQRYLLMSGNALLLTPSIGVGWEPTDRLRIGASFQWGIATMKFATSSLAVNDNNTLARDNDVKAELSAKDLFIPGFTLGTIWSPSDMVDLAGWFKWSAPVEAKGDVQSSVSYFRPQVAQGDTSKVIHGDTSVPDCGTGNPTVTVCGPDSGSVKLPIPMEAKIGVRVHGARPGVSQAHRRDPLSQDKWDAEVDFTFANNQAIDNLQVRFPAGVDGVTGVIPVNGSGGTLPPNADVPHNYKNVFGVRVGGDFNAIPDRLAIRAGAFFESNGQDPRYQNIDFIGGQRIGLSVGGTFRVPLSQREEGGVRKGSALEFSLGFMHMFVAEQSYNDRNATEGVRGLAGSPCNPQANFVGGKCVDGQPVYRTNWPVNLGTITNALNVINVGASYRF